MIQYSYPCWSLCLCHCSDCQSPVFYCEGLGSFPCDVCGQSGSGTGFTLSITILLILCVHVSSSSLTIHPFKLPTPISKNLSETLHGFPQSFIASNKMYLSWSPPFSYCLFIFLFFSLPFFTHSLMPLQHFKNSIILIDANK